MQIKKVLVPESKLWSFLCNLKGLRRSHQAMPKKDDRIVYVYLSEQQDSKILEQAIKSLDLIPTN